ncbi:pheromone A receptor-domain-containing protein [Amylostereum chailletii]|nr:pheromone A receptor-domain-containing protein [Amylostereum chailletii]
MDPTYPLFPIMSLISSSLMLLAIFTSVRQTWNAGVLMLCMWLFLTNVIQGFEAVIWRDNADNKAPVWCDISSHLGIAVNVGVPACSLVITRRLCHIARMKRIYAPRKRERRVQHFIEFFIGIGFPILVMGPFYYVVQSYRFAILEEIGCDSVEIAGGLTTVLIEVWPIILPLVSAIFYCPQIVRIFYYHRRDVDKFLRSNGSINRARYFRILAVGCLDILVTLPTGIMFLVQGIGQDVSLGDYFFYRGWDYTHRHIRTPLILSAAEWRSGFWQRFSFLWGVWLWPVLSIVIFSIFGLTGEARATYRRWFWAIAGLFGFKRPEREDIPDMKFGSPPPLHRVRPLRHSLSMPGSSMMDDADVAISVSSRQPHDEENDSVGTHTLQAREADEAERDAEKRKVEVV